MCTSASPALDLRVFRLLLLLALLEFLLEDRYLLLHSLQLPLFARILLRHDLLAPTVLLPVTDLSALRTPDHRLNERWDLRRRLVACKWLFKVFARIILLLVDRDNRIHECFAFAFSEPALRFGINPRREVFQFLR